MGGGRWSLVFTREAERDLARLDKNLRLRIVEKLEWLTLHFDTVVSVKLTGSYRGFYKERIGDWRVIYQIDWSSFEIIVYNIDHRSRIYK